MGNIVKGIITIATAGAGAGVFGKDAMKVAKLYQKFNQAKQIKTAWDEGEINLFGKKLDISDDDMSGIKPGLAKKSELKKAFGKMSSGKKNSRPLLNKFIGMIA